jgi:beta-lactamase superfamily II metal-dependent hydrolase
MYDLNPLFNSSNPTFNGIELDMLSLGDADAILVTWRYGTDTWRVLIDGGSANDAKTVREFLRSQNVTGLFAVVCTHLHNDHARGLIELVKDKSLTIFCGWMHDMRRYVRADRLRGSSAEGVKEALETTRELASAFASRNITPLEPFAGQTVSHFPNLTILGPTPQFYTRALEESLGESSPYGSFLAALAAAPRPNPFASTLSTPLMDSILGKTAIAPALPPSYLASALTPPPKSPVRLDLSASLIGALGNSGVEEKPKTQPFNNTSAILGMEYNGNKFLFTADAGSEALDAVHSSWKNLLWMQVPHHGSDGNLSQKNIERFCPRTAFVSATGDSSHPDKAIVNGLIKVGAKVYSTHTKGNLWYWLGAVPYRSNYGEAIPLKGTADPLPFAEWLYPPVPGRL